MAMTLPVSLPDPMRTVRRMVPIAWLPPAAGVAVSAWVLQLLDGHQLWDGLGAVWSAVAWSQVASIVLWSRGKPHHQPTTAEQLRPLRKRGWRVASDASLAVGPGGVLVVETKWRSDATEADLAWAVDQVRASRADVASRVRPVVGDAPVIPVMVVWGDGDAELPTAIDGVAIVRGRDLPEWLAELPGDLLAPSLVEMAWSAI
jgi:hypothetical protein